MGRGSPCRPVGGSGVGEILRPILPGVGEDCRFGAVFRGRIGVSGISAAFRALSAGGSAESGGKSQQFIPDFQVFGISASDGLITSIHVEETLGYELPLCRVVVDNTSGRFSYAAFTREQVTFDVLLGYSGFELVSHGTFILQRPKFSHGGRRDNKIELVGYGEAVRLGATERRAVYRKIRDSDIAKEIGKRNGFEVDIKTTEPVHDHVIQANESDYKFLARRAKLHGFVLAVDDGVMRFRPPDPCESGILIAGGSSGGAPMIDVSIRSRTFLRAARLLLSQVDPITKEEFNISSRDNEGELEQELDFRNAEDLVSVSRVGRPERFVTNEGHMQRRDVLQAQITRMAESTRYVVAGTVETVGLETVRPSMIVTLDGIGRSSGRYFVTRATHMLNAKDGGYRTRMDVVRTGADEVSSRSQAVSVPSAGTVALP